MPLFDIKRNTSKESALSIVKKSNEKPKNAITTLRGGGILSIINNAKTIVEEKLGHLKNEYTIIRDIQSLEIYIDHARLNGVIAIDTETTGLDVISDKLVGVCLYTPNEKACYVPVNHISYITNERVANQLTEEEVGRVLSKLNDTQIIMFNADFDIRVLRNQCNCYLTCYWDCYLAARCMNENEDANRLKPLHAKYVLRGQQDEFTFSELFKNITFDLVPIDTAYIYAAHDAIDTYELFDFQRKYLYYDPTCERSDRNGMNGVAWVFFNLEMPLVDVIATIEDTGVELDLDYSASLLDKYKTLLDAKISSIYAELSQYDELIKNYKLTHSNAKIDDKINLSSPTQLAVLFYDILKVDVIDEKKPRGTGEDILAKMNLPVANMILEYRNLEKLIGTYIEKLPKCLNEKDNRLHCRFNQYGADTGRFSSRDPNLQNIPSHNKDIRKMFKATDGYVWMSADYSQQEPKCLAALCKMQGDSQMYDIFMQGKDLYSEIASKSFHVPYEQCKEFNPDGSTNKEGKERRSRAKSILLGVLYGRGEASIAEQLNCSVEEARQIKDSVFIAFPAIKKFEQDSINMSIEKGYVTTVCGRKRRLPSMQLPDYEVVWQDKPVDTDPLNFDNTDVSVPYDIQMYWLNKIYNARGFGSKRKIFEEANKQGLYILDHTREKDTTKVVNARIQGSAADLTKAAMIELDRNQRLKELGFRMLIQVHDEVIAECPEENVKECSQLFAEVMSKAAEKILQMPIRCDVEITKSWYGEKICL